MPNRGGSWAIGDNKMKKTFLATLLLSLNIVPAFAYVRDDTDSGWGVGGTILFFAILIIGAIISLKNQDKK